MPRKCHKLSSEAREGSLTHTTSYRCGGKASKRYSRGCVAYDEEYERGEEGEGGSFGGRGLEGRGDSQERGARLQLGAHGIPVTGRS